MTEFYFINDSGIQIPVDSGILSDLLKEIAAGEKVSFSYIEVIYVDEQEIRRINDSYLGHDYVTDIITFSYREDEPLTTLQSSSASKGSGFVSDELEGTLYMCAPRILEQSAEYQTDAAAEFKRVFIHGLMHLCGYDDKTDEDLAGMRAKEDYYLNVTETTVPSNINLNKN